MARLRSGSRLVSQGRSPRRKSSWVLGPGGTAEAELTASSAAIIGSGAVSLLDGTTIVRVRGEILSYLTAATAAGNGFRVGVGILLSEIEAFTIGITALPKPLADMDSEDWVWHSIYNLRSAGALAGAAAADNDFALAISAVMRQEVDTHAMRKFDEGKILVIVAEVVLVGTATMRIGGEARMLGLLA